MAKWVHPGIRAVFFDAVGTLLFPVPSAVLIYSGVALRLGVHMPHDEIRDRFLAAYRAEEQIDRKTNWVTSEEREVARWRRIVANTLVDVPDTAACFRELFEHFARPAAWTVNPDAAAVFAALQDRGITLGLASNYDARLWSVIDGHPELTPLCDRVVISAAIGFRKPAPEFFREVVRVAGCEPGEILFVGDDIENDYEGALATGLNAVLLEARPNPIAPSPQVPRWIGSLTELIS
ncbi:MAG TPA: HAD-IA family hydrolase [Gemmataceae bacterium]|nr:HAD-IA family hydrolase [Gemmataceae bacterium]